MRIIRVKQSQQCSHHFHHSGKFKIPYIVSFCLNKFLTGWKFYNSQYTEDNHLWHYHHWLFVFTFYIFLIINRKNMTTLELHTGLLHICLLIQMYNILLFRGGSLYSIVPSYVCCQEWIINHKCNKLMRKLTKELCVVAWSFINNSQICLHSHFAT